MKILAFGEVLWDIHGTDAHLGGAPMNFSAHCKKCGAEAWIATAVGKDALGKRTISEIEKLGIHTEYISLSEKETGKCMVTLDEDMVPSYDLLDEVAYDYIQPLHIKHAFDVLYFGTLALRHTNNRNTLKQLIDKAAFTDVFVDMNIRPPFYEEEIVKFAFQTATIIKISDEELPTVMRLLNKGQLSDAACVETLSNDFGNLKIIIITKGDKGALVYDCVDKKSYTCQAKKVKVVSTVGAGDSFSAAFLTKYMQTGNINKSLLLATNISSFVVSCKDAIPPYELSAFDI